MKFRIVEKERPWKENNSFTIQRQVEVLGIPLFYINCRTIYPVKGSWENISHIHYNLMDAKNNMYRYIAYYEDTKKKLLVQYHYPEPIKEEMKIYERQI